MKDLSKEIVKKLKSSTFNSIYLNTLAKLPIVVTEEGAFIKNVSISGGLITEVDEDTHLDLPENIEQWSHKLLNAGYDPDSIKLLKTTVEQRLTKKCKLTSVKKFHYDDAWYSYRFSSDYPEETFGILRLDNMPFRSFDKLENKKSFICRMDQLMFNGLMEPFMLFVNRKFVNWNAIDVVFDCDDVYLLLHGKQYNNYNLDHSEFHMVILPFKCEFLGYEDDDLWDRNLEVFTMFMQDSLIVNDAGKIQIKVPTMYSIYKYKGMIYNVGAWMYNQHRKIYMGLLSESRIAKLKKIILNKYTYDESGNIINIFSTKFNALDRDSYNKEMYDSICHCSKEYLEENALFRFNSDGVLDMENGENILAILDESMTTKTEYIDGFNAVLDESSIREALYRENFLTFKDGLFNPETNIEIHHKNIITVDGAGSQQVVVKIFIPDDLEKYVCIDDPFVHEYISKRMMAYVIAKRDGTRLSAILKNGDIITNIDVDNLKSDDMREIFAICTDGKILRSTDDDVFIDISEEYIHMLTSCGECLNYSYFDKLLYQDNYNHAFNKTMNFNPLLFNDLTKTTIKSTVVSGKTANESLYFVVGNENRKGLKIPRYRYKDHETYVMVFHNGELIETYSNMYVAPNYFFLPVEKEFNPGDTIEFLFFTYCDNNEIHFTMTDNMISKLKSTPDPVFLRSDLLEEYIRLEDMKIFAKYPEEIMFYKELIEERDDIAFNVSYRDSKNNLLIFKEVVIPPSNSQSLSNEKLDEVVGVAPFDQKVPKLAIHEEQSGKVTRAELETYNRIIENIDTEKEINATLPRVNQFTAVSSKKFIYQRIYVDQKAYRLKLDERFRYCDNQKQYLFFINGRRADDDSFLITIPKYSRPFWGMYLYTVTFVKPTDRIEVFYVPEELVNINTEETPVNMYENGYIETEKTQLEVPYVSDFYLFFLNGKKIPSTDLITVDTHTFRLKSDPRTFLRLRVNPIYTSTDSRITDYMKAEKLSKYDELIKYIKDSDNLGYDELDRLFGVFIKLSDSENDKLRWNVARIAIINEIVRDFWVTSGYQYNENPFVYDYALDEYIIKDKNGNYILPALDATPVINILKNYIRLLYFRTEPESTSFEIGSSVSNIKFFWDFSYPIGQATIQLVSQYVNDKEMNINARTYNTGSDEISENTSYHFVFNTMQNTIERTVDIKFCNGIYYGTVDEDILQHYNTQRVKFNLDELIAVIPKDKIIPSSAEQAAENEKLSIVLRENDIIRNISTLEELLNHKPDKFEWPPWLVNVDDEELFAICTDGRILRNLRVDLESGTGEGEVVDEAGLAKILLGLNVVYQDEVGLDFNTYKIGSNNYFVYACPSRLAFDSKTGKSAIKFIMPDLNDPDLIAYGKDDHTTPVYTDGTFDDQNLLVKLEYCKMIYLGEINFTNRSGYTEPYMIWRSNGFFTRKYDDYNFKMQILSVKDFEKTDSDNIVIDEDKPKAVAKKTGTIRLVNTSSPKPTDINDNIVMIDTLLF